MVCTECGNDRFNVIKVLRNRRLRKGRFVINDNVDSRHVICTACGMRFISGTQLQCKVIHKNYKVITHDLQTQQEFLFIEN